MALRDQISSTPIPSDWHPSHRARSCPFRGFSLPTSNTTYTPNQFFDVCLPHYSRGAIRLVGYMIRKTLGWCDQFGNPQDEEVIITYQDLVENAGISRDMIRQAIDEAVAAKFIKCIREGQPKAAGQSAVTGLYALRWDNGTEYIKDRKLFKGFFEGEGNRTDIPNDFFDHLLPQEPLGVIKAVGAIVRFSIGFQAKRGRRRQHVALSYRDIQNYTKIRSSATLSSALQHALESHYIVRVEDGFFDPAAAKSSKAATYSLRWVDTNTCASIGQKTEADGVFDRSEKRSGIGQKFEAEDRSEKRSDIEIKHINKTSKQQQVGSPVRRTDSPHLAAAVQVDVFKKLCSVGFDEKTALVLATNHSSTVIELQIRWLPQREPARNPLGLLRRAIEENWPVPTRGDVETSQPVSSNGRVFATYFFAGLGDNQGEPTAEPSSREITTADRFVERLLRVCNDSKLVQVWGRSFGQLVRERRMPNRQPVNSLVLALRLFGDEFFARQEQVFRRARTEARRVAWQKHEQDFRGLWIEYVRETESSYRQNRIDDYARFAASREGEREKISRSKIRSLADSLLSRFDTDESRLLAFQRYFAPEVFDFATWDSQLNPSRFPAEPVRP